MHITKAFDQNVWCSSVSLPQYAQAIMSVRHVDTLNCKNEGENIRVTGEYNIRTSKVVVTDYIVRHQWTCLITTQRGMCTW